MAESEQREGAVGEAQREVPPSPSGAERTHTRPVYAPRADIYETDDGLVLLVDLPGVRTQDTEITLEKRVLTIRGRAQDPTPAGFSPAYREYAPGHFERMFTLSDEIDGDRIEARQGEGVLRLFLPKTGPAEAKRIQIRGG
jgi:HSP20 family protein